MEQHARPPTPGAAPLRELLVGASNSFRMAQWRGRRGRARTCRSEGRARRSLATSCDSLELGHGSPRGIHSVCGLEPSLRRAGIPGNNSADRALFIPAHQDRGYSAFCPQVSDKGASCLSTRSNPIDPGHGNTLPACTHHRDWWFRPGFRSSSSSPACGGSPEAPLSSPASQEMMWASRLVGAAVRRRRGAESSCAILKGRESSAGRARWAACTRSSARSESRCTEA